MKKKPMKGRKGKVVPPTPGLPGTEKPKKKKQLSIRADLAEGGSLHVRHMTFEGKETLVVGAGEALKLSDDVTSSDGPVWNDVAIVGAWRGHPSGPFVIDATTLNEIVRNFKATKNQDVPVDIDHVSEQPKLEGTLPLADRGAKAHIIDLKVVAGDNGQPKLRGLFDFGNEARGLVRNGDYKFFSPAIVFNAKDRVTGQKIGAYLRSGALTGTPFLDGMEAMAASDIIAAETDPGAEAVLTLSTLAHAPAEYMPSIKRALRLHDLSTPVDCSQHLSMLRDAFDMCDGEVGMTSDGIDLGSYMMPMRDLVGAKPGDTWDEVFDAVDSLIDAAIGDDDEEDESSAAMSDLPDTNTNAAPAAGETIMAMTEAEKAEMAQLKLQTSELTVKLTATETLAATEKARADKAEADKAIVDGQLKLMSDAKDDAEVTAVIGHFGKTHGYKEETRPHLLSMLRAAPESFRATHKLPEAADKAHLFSTQTPPVARPDATALMAEINGETVSITTNRLMKTQKMPYATALSHAMQIHGAAK